MNWLIAHILKKVYSVFLFNAKIEILRSHEQNEGEHNLTTMNVLANKQSLQSNLFRYSLYLFV